MTAVFTVISIILAVECMILLIAFACYCKAFYVSPKQKLPKAEFEIPEGEIYEPYREQMVTWMKEARELLHEDITITSFDGLKLHGRYYEYAPGAPIELMFHGYRGTSERDLCGGVQRCFQLERSALIVDQRASGQSEGDTITFGVLEQRDCDSWVAYMVERFGEDTKILLTGISMGAATVLTAAGHEQPPQVKGVLADCGFSSPKEIICKVIDEMGLPSVVLYPFVKLGARVFGGFDLESASAMQSMKTATLPILFIHGDQDAYVPYRMSKRLYEACASEKKHIVVARGAGHGLGYLGNPKAYLAALHKFFDDVLYPVEEDTALEEVAVPEE